MKKLFYLSAVGLAAMAIAGCEDDPKNPGDFSIKPELQITQIRSLTTGAVYPLEVESEKDTTYEYFYNVRDTMKDESGNPVIGTDGQLIVNVEQKSYFSKKTARLVVFKQVVFPSYEDLASDTMEMEIKANSNWSFPALSTPPSWYKADAQTSNGAGDGSYRFAINRSLPAISKYTAIQNMITRDSMVMYRFTFRHTGTRYNGEPVE